MCNRVVDLNMYFIDDISIEIYVIFLCISKWVIFFVFFLEVIVDVFKIFIRFLRWKVLSLFGFFLFMGDLCLGKYKFF